MNKGLSDELKANFSDLVPIKRSLIKDKVISNPNWISGFVSAEGCFYVEI